MLNRILTATAVGTAGALLSAGVAIANNNEAAGDGAVINAQSVHGHKHQQHGEDSGHLPPTTDSGVLQLLSKTKLKNVVPEKVADVDVLGTTAYLAAWGVTTCDHNGVHVVDVKNPSAPREIGFIKSKIGSYPGEGVQALPLTTTAFTGDILITNNEKCSEPQGFGGLNIYDVTNPARPTPLVEGYGDATVNGAGKKDANEIHSVWAWDAGDKAYAVIVDNEESSDVDIIDITDPKKPALIAEYDLGTRFPQILQEAPASLVEVFLHDMIVKQINGKYEMLLSYWDGGYVRLDMTDPRNPKYLGDTDYAAVDEEGAESGLKDETGTRAVVPEGNGHQAEYTKDNKFILATDEDFGPYKGVTKNVTDGTAITAGTGSDTPEIKPGTLFSGQAVYVGRACPGATITPAPSTPLSPNQIAVVERGDCFFTEKAATIDAANAGYEGILVVNRTGSDGCNDSLGMTVEGRLPTFGVAPREQGYAVFDKTGYDEAACRADTTLQPFPVALGALGDLLSFGSYFDGWGYVRAFERTNGKMKQTDTYAVPQAHDERFATGSGDLSVHEVAMSEVSARRAYVAYYSAGVRAVDLTSTGQIKEVGRFIDTGGSNFWGIEVFTIGGVEYVAGSDRDYGLYLFKAKP